MVNVRAALGLAVVTGAAVMANADNGNLPVDFDMVRARQGNPTWRPSGIHSPAALAAIFKKRGGAGRESR